MPRKSDVIRKWFGNNISLEEAFRKYHILETDDAYEAPFEDCIKTSWPYYAPADSLPASLPTITDIEKVRGTDNDLTKHKCGLGDGSVYRVNEVFAVKFSPTKTMMREMENMLFIKRNPNVRIPKLFAAYTQRADPLGYTSDNPPRGGPRYTLDQLPPYHFLVMEYIEGSTLQEKWEEMEQDDKKNVCIKLGEQLRSLRSIPSPGYYGRAHHQPFLETAGFLMTREQEPLGPYDTYGDMVIAMADAAELQSALGTLEPEWSPKKQLIIDHLRNAYTTCEYTEAKFTHTDLKFDNIMLEPIIASQEHGKQEYKVVIIDWTRAAWYPAWVEAMDVLSQRPDRTIKSFAEELQPLPDMDIFRYYVAQGFEPFPHKDAVYFSQVMEELCMIL